MRPRPPSHGKRDKRLSTILEPGQIEASASSPPFLHLPPPTLFALRAARLERLAVGHPLAEYIGLVAGLCRVQQQLLEQPPSNVSPDPERQRLCLEHGLPPLAAGSLVREDLWLPWLDALLSGYATRVPAVRQAISTLQDSRAGQRKVWALALLGDQYAGLPAALVPFLGAALQAAWSYWLWSGRTLAWI